jgi:hypothetical protein
MNRARPTRAQIKSMHELFQRSPDGSPNYRTFRKRFRLLSFDNILGGTWHGTFIGIEADGYRHS